MSLLGGAVLAVWNDIAPEARSEFMEWHNREHIPERMAITGFRRGRRYIAREGAPEYFTLYEVDNVKIFASAEYLERLQNPSDWTRRVANRYFSNNSRGVCPVILSLGNGDGGAAITLRFDTAPGREGELRTHLVQALPLLETMIGVTGAHLCIADPATSAAQAAQLKGRAVGIVNWVVMIEGIDGAAVNSACDRLLAAPPEQFGAAGPISRGLYVLEISRSKDA